MTRIEFTRNICQLITEMIEQGEYPIIDFVKRSAEEQKRLYEAGLSKCDGVINVSAHQLGKAMDIYFVENGILVAPKAGFQYWHNRWCDLGGDPMISWDQGHWEG